MSDKPEKREPSARAKHVQSKKSDPTLFWRIACSVLLLAVIVLGVLLYFSRSGLHPQVEVTPAPEQTAPPSPHTAWLYTPAGDPTALSSEDDGTLRLPAGPQIDGYRFIGWNDSEGNPVQGDEVTLYADAAFSAVYAIAFRDGGAAASHEPYLSLDSEGLFHPDASISRALAVKLLYESLDTELEGTAVFSDVDPSADYAVAAATLKDLGVIEGSRFHPDEPITYGELFVMLSHFFPRSTTACAFEQIPVTDARYPAFCLAMEQGWIDDLSLSPESDLTRAAAAHIFNRLRGRGDIAETDYAKVGTLLDVSFHHPYFWDIAEAAIPHEAERSESGELWLSSQARELRSEGPFFIGTALHCIDADGGAVVNGSYGNFDFGLDGVVTTGMPELDKLVQAKLAELVDPASMGTERMLYILYNYVTYSNEYLRVHYYDVGDVSWVNDEAYYMFTVGKGNCYCYASQFYVLVKAIGVDAVIYSGTIEPNDSPHAWVEIEIDGEPYIYDTNLEYTQVHFNHFHGSFYKEPYWKAKGWHYFRGEEIEAEIAARG